MEAIMKVLLIALFSLVLPAISNAADLYRDKQVWVYDSTTEASQATVQIAGAAAKAIYNSLTEPQQPHRGLFIRASQDGKVHCVRYMNPEDISCDIDYSR